jgi:hypothetical protein
MEKSRGHGQDICYPLRATLAKRDVYTKRNFLQW